MNHLLTSCVTGNHHCIQVQYVVIQCKYCAMCSWWTNADYCKVTFIGTSLHGVYAVTEQMVVNAVILLLLLIIIIIMLY